MLVLHNIGGERLMLTALGRFLRKLRIDNDEILANMAETLGVTASYISAVEHGKRPMPNEWRDIIVTSYKLDEAKKEELDELIINSLKKVTINAENATHTQRELAFSFARRVSELPEDKLHEIQKILGGD